MEKKGQPVAKAITKAITIGKESSSQAHKDISRPPSSVPIEIFSQNLSPLEAVTSYLKYNHRMRFCHIAKALNRDIRTIWITYLNAQKKQQSLDIPGKTSLRIPIAILSNRRFSISEIIVFYLIEMRGLTLTQVSALLNKSTSTIWTSHKRARVKMGVAKK